MVIYYVLLFVTIVLSFDLYAFFHGYIVKNVNRFNICMNNTLLYHHMNLLI